MLSSICENQMKPNMNSRQSMAPLYILIDEYGKETT
jgi:hypothetical protein